MPYTLLESVTNIESQCSCSDVLHSQLNYPHDAGADCVRTVVCVCVCFALTEKVEMLSRGSSDGHCTELNDLGLFVYVC